MNQKYYTVLGRLEAKPGKEKELEEILFSLIEPSLRENGCINYNLYRCHGNPAAFMFYENWESKAALEQHAQSEHIKAWHVKRDELLAKPIEVTFWEMIK